MVSLATQGFYDDTPCPRLVTGQGLQVLQCGDPTGSGSGGPGYRYAEEPPQGLAPSPLSPQAANYSRGLVAMAKASDPGTTGSQFFLVYGDSALPPEYSVVGRIATPGLEVLDRVGAGGDDGSNQAGRRRPPHPGPNPARRGGPAGALRWARPGEQKQVRWHFFLLTCAGALPIRPSQRSGAP